MEVHTNQTVDHTPSTLRLLVYSSTPLPTYSPTPPTPTHTHTCSIHTHTCSTHSHLLHPPTHLFHQLTHLLHPPTHLLHPPTHLLHPHTHLFQFDSPHFIVDMMLEWIDSHFKPFCTDTASTLNRKVLFTLDLLTECEKNRKNGIVHNTLHTHSTWSIYVQYPRYIHTIHMPMFSGTRQSLYHAYVQTLYTYVLNLLHLSTLVINVHLVIFHNLGQHNYCLHIMVPNHLPEIGDWIWNGTYNRQKLSATWSHIMDHVPKESPSDDAGEWTVAWHIGRMMGGVGGTSVESRPLGSITRK